MKRTTIILTAILLSIANLSATVAAGEILPVPSPVIITEVQTGSASGSDEFIELLNVSEEAVNVTGWQLRYSNAASAGDGTTLIAVLKNADDSPLWLEPGEYYVVHTASIHLTTGAKSQVYAAKLSAADKAIGLFSANPETCRIEVADAVAWGTSTKGEGLPAVASGTGERLVARGQYASATYVDTDNNMYDFAVSSASGTTPASQQGLSATPGSANTFVMPDPTGPIVVGSPSSLPDMALDGCTLPPPPAPAPIDEPPLPPPTTEPPATVEPAPEPPPARPVMPAQNAGLVAPQLTEVLPNPAKPSLDSRDEFVEVYNSNDRQFELSGFMIEVGRKRYTFPIGTMLEARSFRAFLSRETRLALPNNGGQVRLLDPLGRVISQTDPYGAAKDGQAWALGGGTWQWTTAPSIGTANTIRQPQPKQAARTTKTTTTKSLGTLPANTTTRQTDGHQETTPLSTKEAGTATLHPTVLAIGGVLAVLYGAYEYRRDMANKLYQLRTNRAVRREARQGAEGR